jgi:hypothetical protein
MLNSAYPTPLALTFLNPLFAAAGVGLVSIPIIIHILNRQRFKVVTWAAMDFLLRAMRKNRRRVRFEQILLLATRCLLVFLIAFALARPLAGCSRQSLAGLGGRSGMNVFVIDNSYSTAYESSHPGTAPGQAGGRTHLEQEKLIAKRLIDTLNPGGESVAIITAARPATAIISKPGYDLNAAKAAVDRIDPSYAGTDLAGALQLAQKLAEEEPKVGNKVLYLLSDGTRSAWESQQAEAIRRAGIELAKQYRITHFNMTEGHPQWNQAVAEVRPGTNLVTTKFPSELLALPRGYGAAPDAPLEWWLDGRKLGDATRLKLEPNTDPQKLDVSPKDLKTGGPHVFKVTVLGDGNTDPLKVDNSRLRVVDVAAELKVLIVEGTRGNTALEGSGAFLQLALAPPSEAPAGPGGPKSDSYVSADLISDIELRGKALNDYRAVVLAGVGQVTAPEADGLRSFVENGGTLIVFAGEPVSKENYNAILLPRKLMPGPLIKLVDSPPDAPGYNFDFDPKREGMHPFLSIFRNQDKTGLDTAKVFTYWQVDVAPDSGVERVLNYLPPKDPTGAPARAGPPDPAITHHMLGLGHVIFVSTTAGPGPLQKPWTTLPAKPIYVELMHEMLAGGVRPGDYWMNLTVGQPLEIPPQVKLSGTPELWDEANTVIPVEPVTDKDPTTGADRPTVYRSRPLIKPGQYSLNLGNGTVPIVVNVPAEEADVRTIGNDQIRKALGDIDVALQGDEVPSEAALDQEGHDWAAPVLVAVLCLLGVECFMAMAFGHYRRSEVVRG